MARTGRRIRAESPPDVLWRLGSVPPEIKSRVTETRYPMVGTRMAQRGNRGQGRKTVSAHATKTTRLAQYSAGLSGPGGRAALAWATAASPMKMDALTKNRRRRRRARA